MNALESVHGYSVTPKRLRLFYGTSMALDFGAIPSPVSVPRLLFNRFDSSRSAQYTLTLSSAAGENGFSVDSSALLASAPQNGRIAYTVVENGLARVVVSGIDGSGRKELYTFPDAFGTGPETVVLSPDGSRVAFGIERADKQFQTLMVAATDGSSLVKISGEMADGAAPAFSPDGSRIAFYSGDSTDYSGNGSSGRLSVADVDGTSEPTIVASNARPVYGYVFGYERLEWSPDGSRIAFNGTQGYGGSDIYVVNPDGSGLTNLTNDGLSSSWPTWSPDGTWIAYTGGSRIRRVRTDGTGGGEQLTPQSAVADELYPQWSPDGKRIVFVAITEFVTSPGAYPGRLTMLDVESRQISTVAGRAYKAFWTP
jgi:TolB protein